LITLLKRLQRSLDMKRQCGEEERSA